MMTNKHDAIVVHFDTEFSHLDHDPLTPELAGLISIGCITENGDYFYAENANPQVALYSDFVKKIVIPLLDGGDTSMPYQTIAKQLKAWVESLGGEVVFVSDAPCCDWPHACDLFNHHGWPHNLRKTVEDMGLSGFQLMRYLYHANRIFKGNPSLRKHHAGDDASVHLMAYKKVTGKSFNFIKTLLRVFRNRFI